MNLSKKQLRLIEHLESCGGWDYLDNINQSIYPRSMIDALIDKGFVFSVDALDGKAIASSTFDMWMVRKVNINGIEW